MISSGTTKVISISIPAGVGDAVGLLVGRNEGSMVGVLLGPTEGDELGAIEGQYDGWGEVGKGVGDTEGLLDGVAVQVPHSTLQVQGQ